MRIKDVIKAPKTDVVFGEWESNHIKRMPKSTFPLSKSGRSLQLGAGYDWCTIEFSALGRTFRVLVAVDFRKVDYYAHLGEIQGQDTRMLSSFEYHATHGGWHVHAGCGDINLIPSGRYKGPWKRNIPRDHAKSRQTEWDVQNKDDAMRRACNRYGISMTGTQPPLL